MENEDRSEALKTMNNGNRSTRKNIKQSVINDIIQKKINTQWERQQRWIKQSNNIKKKDQSLTKVKTISVIGRKPNTVSTIR